MESKDLIITTSSLVQELTRMKTLSIVGIVLIFTFIGFFATIVISIIFGIKILSTDWKDEEINNNKLLWGLLTFFPLGPISSLIFANIALNKLK